MQTHNFQHNSKMDLFSGLKQKNLSTPIHHIANGLTIAKRKTLCNPYSRYQTFFWPKLVTARVQAFQCYHDTERLLIPAFNTAMFT